MNEEGSAMTPEDVAADLLRGWLTGGLEESVGSVVVAPEARLGAGRALYRVEPDRPVIVVCPLVVAPPDTAKAVLRDARVTAGDWVRHLRGWQPHSRGQDLEGRIWAAEVPLPTVGTAMCWVGVLPAVTDPRQTATTLAADAGAVMPLLSSRLPGSRPLSTLALPVELQELLGRAARLAAARLAPVVSVAHLAAAILADAALWDDPNPRDRFPASGPNPDGAVLTLMEIAGRAPDPALRARELVEAALLDDPLPISGRSQAARTVEEAARRAPSWVQLPQPASAGVADAFRAAALEVAAHVARAEPVVPLLVVGPGAGRDACLGHLTEAVARVDDGALAGRRVLRLQREDWRTGAALAAVEALVKVISDPLVVILEGAFDQPPRPGDTQVVTAVSEWLTTTGCLVVVTAAVVADTGLWPGPVVVCAHAAQSEGREPMEPVDLTAAANRLAAFHQVGIHPDAIVAAAAAPTKVDTSSDDVDEEDEDESPFSHNVDYWMARSDEPLPERKAIAAPDSGPALIQPALGITRLDLACARARLRGDRLVTVADIDPDPRNVGTPTHSLSAAQLRKQLSDRVLGQEAAHTTLADRVTLGGMRLGSGPRAVLVFAGRSGVGKTKTALQLPELLFGSPRKLVRVDCGGLYSSHTVSALIGAPPGYVGSDEPARLTRQLKSIVGGGVLLLDEVEKASSRVMDAFLEAFDAGTFTDLQGISSDLSKVVVVMTSNVGSRALSHPTTGFLDNDNDQATSLVLRQVRELFRPEFSNRIDDIIVFEPLPASVLVCLVESAIDRLRILAGRRGYTITVDPKVAAHLAGLAPPGEGARPLQRIVEQHLAATLLAHTPGPYIATVSAAGTQWTPQ